MNFWSNTDRFMVSQLKAYYGTHATQRQRLRATAPSAAAASCRRAATRTGAGRTSSTTCTPADMEGFFSFGMNPVSNGPHSRKAMAALSKLKWLVVAENFEQETATFWRDDILALVDKKPEDVQTEVFLLPAANFAEKDGIVRQLGALDPVEVEGGRSAGRGQARSGDHRAHLPEGARALRDAKAARFPDPIRQLNWWYSNPRSPSLDEVAKEINGWAIARRSRSRPATWCCAPASSWRASSTRAPTAPRCRATGCTSGCTPMPATSTQRRSHRRSERPRPLSGLGLQLAGQPAHSLQPLLRRRRGPAVGSVAAGDRLERDSDGRATCPTSPPTARRPPGSARS